MRGPARVALALQPVDQPGDRGRRQTGRGAQFRVRHRPCAEQDVERFLLGGRQATALRDRRVEHDRRRADLTPGQVQPLGQRRALGTVVAVVAVVACLPL